MPSRILRPLVAGGLITLALAPAARADNVIADDNVVQGSQCIGFDCVDNESFGYDTLRLQENNTQIAFDDTSATAGYAANDWALRANETTSGGANVFQLLDVTGSKTPFSVFAGAPTDSLRVAGDGKVGLGTSSPGLKLHLKNSDTPGVRLEQDNSSGFTAQTWDVAGNEANFFIRDLTGGSKLPFRIRPGAPTSSVDIQASGNVGLGTSGAAFPLDVTRNGVSAPLARLSTDGAAQLRFENTATTSKWDVGSGASNFTVAPAGGANALVVSPTGDSTASGVAQQNADGAAMENSTAADDGATLDKIKTLHIAQYELAADPSNAKHVGPTGADFRAAFGLGASDGSIAPADLASVSLVGLQALARKVDSLDTSSAANSLKPRIDGLEATTATMRDQIGRLFVFGTTANKRIAALEKANTSLSRRLNVLEKKVKKLR